MSATDNNDDVLSVRLLRLLRLLRPAVRLMRNDTVVSFTFLSKQLRFNPGLLRVAQLLIILLCTCHWIGCVWWLVSSLERQRGEFTRWGPSNTTLAAGFDVQYAHAFLWGASLMTGFMPFDIIPVSLPRSTRKSAS